MNSFTPPHFNSNLETESILFKNYYKIFVLVTFFLFSLSPVSMCQNLNQDFITIESNSSLSSVAQTRYNFWSGRNSVLNIDRISIDNPSAHLNQGSLSFQHPYTGQLLTFVVDRIVDYGNGDYHISGSNFQDNSTLLISKKHNSTYGYISLVNENDYLRITKLDESQSDIYLIRQDKSNSTNSTAQCAAADYTVLDEYNNDDETSIERCNEHLRVLFLVEEGADLIANPRDVAFTVEDQFNLAASQSGVNARMQVAEVVNINTFLTDFSEGHGKEVNRLSNNEEVQELRNTYQADIVFLLMRDFWLFDNGDQIFGRAHSGRAEEDEAFAMHSIFNAVDQFGVVHEIGHLLGANHQDDIDPGGCPTRAFVFTNYHGFVSEDESQETIMSRCLNTSMPRFSSRNGTFPNGDPSGDSNNKNAKIISRWAGKACCFRHGAPAYTPQEEMVNISIQGPTVVDDCNSSGVTWNVVENENYGFEDGPLNYLWEFSLNGMNSWTSLSTNGVLNSSDLNAIAPLPTSFYLRVTVTDILGNFGQREKNITLQYCRISVGNDSITEKVQMHSISGKLIFNSVNFDVRQLRSLSLPTGIYVVSYYLKNGEIKTEKIAILSHNN